MSNVLLFVQQGWKNLWKQNSIWLFSALLILVSIFNVLVKKPEMRSTWFLPFLYFAESLVSFVLVSVSLIGVSYILYCSSIGKSVSIREVLSAVQRFIWRVMGCSCIVFLIAFPLFFLALAFSLNASTQPPQISSKIVLLLSPLAMFTAMWDFTMFEFFSKDGGIRESLKNAWRLFIDHFNTLAILGLLMTLIFRLSITLSGILTVLIQSGFDLTVLNTLDYVNPSAALSRNLLFVLINGVCQIILTPFNISAFALAYLKYSDMKISVTSDHGINTQ